MCGAGTRHSPSGWREATARAPLWMESRRRSRKKSDSSGGARSGAAQARGGGVRCLVCVVLNSVCLRPSKQPWRVGSLVPFWAAVNPGVHEARGEQRVAWLSGGFAGPMGVWTERTRGSSLSTLLLADVCARQTGERETLLPACSVKSSPSTPIATHIGDGLERIVSGEKRERNPPLSLS